MEPKACVVLKTPLSSPDISGIINWESMFAGSDQALMILKPSYEIIAVNKKTEELLGKTEAQLVRRKCHNLFHGSDSPHKNCPLRKTLRSGKAESSVIEDKERQKTFFVSCTPSLVGTDSFRYIIHSCAELTSSEKSEEKTFYSSNLLKAFFEIGRLLAKDKGQKKVLQQVCDILTKVGKYPMAWIGLMEDGCKKVAVEAHSGISSRYLEMMAIALDDSSALRNPLMQTIKTGKVSIARNFSKAGSGEAWTEVAVRCGCRSWVAIPIKKEEKTFGSLQIYSHVPSAFRKDELNLLSKIGNDIAIALKSYAAEEAKKKAELALVENEIRFRYLVEINSDLAWTINNDARYSYISPQAQDLTGFSPDEFRGKSFFHLIPPQKRRHIAKTIKPLIKNHEPFSNIEIEIQHKNGSALFFEVSGIPMFEGSGKCVGFRGIMRDITKRRQTELEIRNTSEQLQHLLKSLPVIPFTCRLSKDMEITYVGGAVEEITGYSAECFVDDVHFWRSQIVHDTSSDTPPDFQGIFEKGEHSVEYLFRVADGSYRWFFDTRRLVKNPDGAVSHVVGTWHDISEQKKIRQESEYRLKQLVQADKLASLGEVVAGVAHEINNPNSFISYNIPLIKETWELFEPIIKKYGKAHQGWQNKGLTIEELCQDMHEIIKALKTGSDRINRVVSNLKDFARLDKGAVTKLIQINKVIEDAWVIVGAQARKSFGKIDINLGRDIPDIHGHYHKLEQVVANLVVNACSAVPEKERSRLAVSSRYIKRLNAVLIEIEDNGVGIEPNVISHIFEPFFTTRRDSGGTGLGLSVSYGLIQEHNGILGVHSKPGIGTKFLSILPVDRRDAEMDIKPTILCVDNDPGFLHFLKTFFVDIEMPFAVIDTSEEVLDYLEEHPEIDIIFFNLMMPGIDSRDLVKKIKTRCPLVTIIMSSDDNQALSNNAFEWQPDIFLTKPTDAASFSKIFHDISRIIL